MLLFATAGSSASAGTEPGYSDAIVATSEGFVAFTHYGIQFSSDGIAFKIVARLPGTTPNQVTPVAGGVVAAARSELHFALGRGEIVQPAFPCTNVIGLAGDGRTAVAMTNGNRIYTWTGGNTWNSQVVEANASFWQIGHGLGRWWIAGQVELGEAEYVAALWSSPDGLKWSRVPLPAASKDPTTGNGREPHLFPHLFVLPGCVLAIEPFGLAAVSTDGTHWNWVKLPDDVDPKSIQVRDGHFARSVYQENKLVASLVSLDGLKWAPAPPRPEWSAWRALPGGQQDFFQVTPAAAKYSVIIRREMFAAPARFATELGQIRLAAETATATRARVAEAAKATQAEPTAKASAAKNEAKAKARAPAPSAPPPLPPVVVAAVSVASPKTTPVTPAAPDTATRALAALATCDRALHFASTYDSLAKPAAELIHALDALPDKPVADAVMKGALEFLRLNGGAQGFYTFLMEMKNARFSEATKYSSRLSAPQRTMIRELAGQKYDKNGKWVGDTAKPVDLSSWPARDNPKGGPKTDDLVDLAKVRGALVNGAAGAAMDLEAAYEFGLGVPQHTGAAAFWRAVGAQLSDAKAATPRSLRSAAVLGSAFAMADLADEFQRLNGGQTTAEITAWRQRAAAGGLRLAGGDTAATSLLSTLTAKPFTPPRLVRPLLARTHEALEILARPEYRLPVTSMEQEERAHGTAISGMTAAINQGDPATLIAHLAGWLQVRRSAEVLARTYPALKLPAHDLQRHLLSFVEPHRRNGEPGMAALIRLVMDREVWRPGRFIEERETVRDDEFGWRPWRERTLGAIHSILCFADTGDLTGSGPAIPPWSPVVRHPAELFDARFVPLSNGPAHRPASPDLNALKLSYPQNPGAILLTVHGPDGARPPESVGANTRSVTERIVGINRDYDRQVAERTAALAAIEAKVAAVEKKIAANPPVNVTRTTKRVLVGTDRQSTYRTRGINENGPGTRQGDQVFGGFVDVPIYREVVDVQTTPDYNHPLYLEKRNLEAERKNKPMPPRLSAVTTDAVTTHYDRWSATLPVAATFKEHGTARTVWLNVPMTFEHARPPGQTAPNWALGSAGLRRMLTNPATTGAAAVHRTLAVFLLHERLTPKLGEVRARMEAALAGELLFGFEPDGGGVLEALRELDRAGAKK